MSVAAPDELLDRLGVPGNHVIDDTRRFSLRQSARFSDPPDDFFVWHPSILLRNPITCTNLPDIGQI